MHNVVEGSWLSFTSTFEGRVTNLYPDILGKITIAVGNLCDSIADAQRLPLMTADDTLATPDQIAAEWQMMHDSREVLAKGGWRAAARIATLHLTPPAIDHLVESKRDEMAAFLVQRFPEFENWPAAAQLGTLSLSWACGPGFVYPLFSAAVKAQDFLTAAKECWIGPKLVRVVTGEGKVHIMPAPFGTPISDLVPDPHNPGVHARNIANVALFEEAAAVVEAGALLDVLHYPARFVSEAAAFEMGPAADEGGPLTS